jgi:hypothetical protein
VTHRDKPELEELRLGEDPESKYAGDVHHWLGVYSELLRLVDEAVLDLGHEHSLSDTELGRYTQLFQRRLAFWQAKSRELEQPALDVRDANRDLH